jgi:restriction system protein
MKKLTIEDLRQIIAKVISKNIDLHRASRANNDESNYVPPEGPPTNNEIDDFVVSNPLMEMGIIEHLIDPGFLGFSSKTLVVDEQWLEDFKYSIKEWAETNTWLGADDTWMVLAPQRIPKSTQIWTPTESIRPSWVDMSPACLILAADLLRNGKLLCEMNWRNFEELIGVLLEKEGWKVEVTQATRDGGIDVVAIKKDEVLGEIKAVWQAKKYGLSNKVKLKEVRELSAIRDEAKASKAIVVTTSSLTKDAIDWVKRDIYRLDYKDKDQLEMWVKNTVL